MSSSKERLASIIESLDNVASSVEAKGLLREAEALDIVSNTIEKMATDIPAGSDRPAPIFSDKSSKVKDDKDHFPIPDAAHARNAISRVNQYSSVPSWYDGSLKELKAKVYSAVRSRYPGIKISEDE
jgi:hypothetical protein